MSVKDSNDSMSEMNRLSFETGTLSKEEVEAILNMIPIKINFVDSEDIVRFYNKAEKRSEATKKSIGRKVQLCHQTQSNPLVNKMLDAFRTGRKEETKFWTNKDGKITLIRHFAIKSKNGKYLGTLEVSEDITDIKKIEGEKRLHESEI